MKLILTLVLLGGCQCGVTKVCTGETCDIPKQTEPMDIPPRILPGGRNIPGLSMPGSGGWW